MRRTVLLALLLVAAGCGQATEEPPRPKPQPAGPQRAELGWREPYPAGRRERLVFVVETFEVTESGWSATVAMTNETEIAFAVRPTPGASSYGLMLFARDDLDEFERATREGTLPTVRQALEIEPLPPRVLAPGDTWRGRLAAPGALGAGSHVRVVFGPFRAEGDPPEDIEPAGVWITDHSYQLTS